MICVCVCGELHEQQCLDLAARLRRSDSHCLTLLGGYMFISLEPSSPQSSNPFAALDDSGDEAPAKAKSIAVKKDTKKATVTKPVEASKVDQRYV